jgi:opacity protein-like surface antigen
VKKLALALVVTFVLAAPVSGATRWQAGLYGGLRTIKDETLRSVYGGGFIYTPFVSYRISKKLWIGAEYEGGYAKESKIGLFAEESRLAVQGVHAFIQYGRDKGKIRPYLKVGAGFFRFNMDIDSPYVRASNFSSSDISILVGGGARIMLTRKIFGAAEIKYAALWADPFDDMVDLGGIRFLAGLGLEL